MGSVVFVGAYAFVLFVLVAILLGLYELTPLARHDQLRDPRTGKRRWDSPHLETRDEFEQHDRLAH